MHCQVKTNVEPIKLILHTLEASNMHLKSEIAYFGGVQYAPQIISV